MCPKTGITPKKAISTKPKYMFACNEECIVLCFSGVPAVVDFAAMRDAMSRLGGNPEKINPVCPADLVIDHSVQADLTRR